MTKVTKLLFALLAFPGYVLGEEVDLYLLGGQSNMNGSGRTANLPKAVSSHAPNALYQFGAAWLPLDLTKTRTSHQMGQFGPELGFAHEMKSSGRTLYLSKYAASGMGLHHGWHGGKWAGGNPALRRKNFYPGEKADDPNQGTLYLGMVRKFQIGIEALKKAGRAPVIRGFVWMQGEQDSKNEVSAKEYGKSLLRLQRRLSEDLATKRTIPLVFGQVLPHLPADERFTHSEVIRDQMERVGQAADLKMISTDGFGLLPDRVHYDAAGQLQLGQAFAKAFKKIVPLIPKKKASPGIHLEETRTIASFFKAHCTKCHNAEKKKGGINFLKFTDFQLENAKHWQEALDNLQRGDMPPEESIQPSIANRKVFVAQVLKELDHVYADSDKRDFRFSRLTNSQIAWNLRDLLQIDQDFSGDLIEDPAGKHGESLQSELELTAGHMEVYLSALQKAVELAVPDLNNPPKPYILKGNDWEKQHYLNRNDLAHGNRRKHRRYRGPKWLGDDFEVPVPPNHFFRIYVDDNRQEGPFRVRIRVRNEPPEKGGDLTKHEFSLFFDRGFKSPQHTIDSFTVEAKPGSQEFEVFGNVFDFPGVDPAPVSKEDPYGITAHFHYRFLTVQNSSPLTSPSDKPVKNNDWVTKGDAHFIRADDRWTDAWGADFAKTNWLKPSHAGSDHPTRGKPAVYKEVMKDTSYAVIEQIEFDLPWQWPPASVQPFMKDGKLDDDAIAREVKSLTKRAWRRPLTEGEDKQLDALISETLKSSQSKIDALRDLLMAVFADTRFLFHSDVEQTQNMQNHELVGRLSAFLWRSAPDQRLFDLASRNGPITDSQLSAEVRRMLADSRSDRFIADFTSSWAGFSKFKQIAINPNYYRWWNPKYKDYMKLEPAAFLKTLLREDLSCLNCISSDFMVVNDVMAKYYGAPLPGSGHRFSRVPAIEGRGGVLTQAAFLLAHSDGEDAHAVNRGVWLRGRLLGDPPRDPPSEVPVLNDLDERDSDAAGLSTKERLSIHRKGICLDCHADIDSWGIPMESYDAAGKLREKVLRLTPDRKVKRRILGVFDESEARGSPVHGMNELQKLLREKHATDFAKGFSSSMLSFALGRPLSYQEDKTLAHLAKDFEKSDYRMAQLIDEIVRLPAFRHPNKKLQ